MLDQDKHLLLKLSNIAIQAGIKIMEFYETNFKVEKKKDNTPITKADLAANSIIIKKSGVIDVLPFTKPLEKKSCSFERIYFSRGNDKDIYKERKELGSRLFPQVKDAIKSDFKNTVFSFIPNTAETSFLLTRIVAP